jgi:hypothetical protein
MASGVGTPDRDGPETRSETRTERRTTVTHATGDGTTPRQEGAPQEGTRQQEGRGGQALIPRCGCDHRAVVINEVARRPGADRQAQPACCAHPARAAPQRRRTGWPGKAARRLRSERPQLQLVQEHYLVSSCYLSSKQYLSRSRKADVEALGEDTVVERTDRRTVPEDGRRTAARVPARRAPMVAIEGPSARRDPQGARPCSTNVPGDLQIRVGGVMTTHGSRRQSTMSSCALSSSAYVSVQRLSGASVSRSLELIERADDRELSAAPILHFHCRKMSREASWLPLSP